MTRLTIVQRNKAIAMLINGTSTPQVAKIFRVQRPQLLDYGADAMKRQIRLENP